MHETKFIVLQEIKPVVITAGKALAFSKGCKGSYIPLGRDTTNLY